MIKVRTVFSKLGRAKYISHLDLNRFILRAFKRSGLPIWYTEGFNPQPYVAFALALSLGFESICEVMDFKIDSEIGFAEIKDRLNAVMPEGLEFAAAFAPERKVNDIAKAEYDIYLNNANAQDALVLFEKFKDFYASEQILTEKKTKKGVVAVDIKPHAELTELAVRDAKLAMTLRMPAGTQTNFNPQLLLTAFQSACGVEPEMTHIRRTRIICADGCDFV